MYEPTGTDDFQIKLILVILVHAFSIYNLKIQSVLSRIHTTYSVIQHHQRLQEPTLVASLGTNRGFLNKTYTCTGISCACIFDLQKTKAISLE